MVLDGRFSVQTDVAGRFDFPVVATGHHVISVVSDNLPLPWTLVGDGRKEVEVTSPGPHGDQHRRAASPLELIGLIHHAAADHGLQNLDVGDLLRWDVEEFAIENDEIGELTHFQRTGLALLMQLIG